VTPDVLVRPYTPEDALPSFEAIRESMDALMPWMPWCVPDYSLETQQDYVASRAKDFAEGTMYEMAIVAPDGRYLGGTGLNQLDRLNHRANLGYWVRTSEAGRGIATAAVHLVRDWAFANTDFVRLEIVAAVGNVASIRVAEKSGAHFEGTLRRRLVLHGVAHDAAMFSFTREIPIPA
jgi:RimJ/RimL family protein N-acetyltransferase